MLRDLYVHHVGVGTAVTFYVVISWDILWLLKIYCGNFVSSPITAAAVVKNNYIR